MLWIGTSESVVRLRDHTFAHFSTARAPLRFEDHILTLSVIDDGRGFDPAAATRGPHRPAGGNGLDNMRRRVESLGGRFELASRPGQGTRVHAVVHLKA